jgi:thiol:disulfide interchange protein/DsbC/DsbD-like thiol-disulfide interchange protein
MAALRFVLKTMLAALLALLAFPAVAQAPGAGPHIRIDLLPETEQPAPGGTVTLAFVSQPQQGWHGYWRNPGDAGVPTRLDWRLPQGVTADALQYPLPQRLLIAGLMNYVYEGPFTQLVTLHIPAGLKPGTALPISVTMDYLVCTLQMCVPEKQTLSTSLTLGDGAVPADRAAQFARWRALIPMPLQAQGTWERVEARGADGKPEDRFRLSIPVAAGATLKDPYFYAVSDGAVDYATPQTITRSGDSLIIETKAGRGSDKVEGVLAIGDGRGLAFTAAKGVVAAPEGSAVAGFDWNTVLLALGGAILGGLLLNVMPCVFPILSLKALSLARAGETGSQARHEGLAYTAGVVLVCLALGGVMLGLRAAGASAGWAFQLQDPRVILVLLVLVTAIALNLTGLFEFATPRFINQAAANGPTGAFFTGVLAAFIATPCSGPFMGVALGTALVLPWPAALAIFAGLGLGLALPFLLLGFVPVLRKLLPRPGAWMNTFRHILSVPMFLTALGLAWVLGRETGVDGMAIGLFAALLLGFGLWWTGQRQSKGKSFAWVAGTIAAVLALATAAQVHPSAGPAVPSAPADGTEPFSEARLAELRGQGKPVFAYFTADWCVTCKVNEKAVIETDKVRSALRAGKVVVLVGDWTNGDPALGRFIQSHNRAGVPLYLWYGPGQAEPRVLPQILTQSMLAGLAAAPGAG